MKKTLNDIFEKANAKDIEPLVNKNDVPKVPDDTLSSIKNQVYEKIGILRKKKKKPLFFCWKFYVASACCLCLILGGIFVLPKVTKRLFNTLNPEEINQSQIVQNEATPPEGNPNQSNNNNNNIINNNNNNDNSQNSDESTKVLTMEQLNNGVLKEVSPENTNVPENMKFLGTTEATEENNATNITATVVLYTLDGDVVNWKTENDLIYVITQGNNRLVVLDSKNMTPIYNIPLSGVPAEMNIEDDKIYISLPDLCKIDVFSKSDCSKISSIRFDHEVSSFCLDGNYIYYTEHYQHCAVFKKNLTTGALQQVQLEKVFRFYCPKIYLNKEDRILYIGESGTSGSDLYYFDADTLELKSVFTKNNYGIWNHTREIFHYGDEIFWGNYRLSDTDATELIGRYGTEDSGSLTFVSEEIVSTYEGLFLTETYECIVNYWEADFDFEYILISESYNVFFRQRSGDQNIIVGVNFELQEILGTFV